MLQVCRSNYYTKFYFFPQWWLDIYPLLAENDKALECSQLPWNIISVRSGQWHRIINLDTFVVVTQNFENMKKFEFMCMDMSPRYHHRGLLVQNDLLCRTTWYIGILCRKTEDIQLFWFHIAYISQDKLFQRTLICIQWIFLNAQLKHIIFT